MQFLSSELTKMLKRTKTSKQPSLKFKKSRIAQNNANKISKNVLIDNISNGASEQNLDETLQGTCV